MSYSVRDLLASEHVSPRTRAVLEERLAEPADRDYAPQFFAPEAYALLLAVAARLLPQPERGDQAIPLAVPLDRRLAEGRADGWRYDTLPPDREAYRLGLGGIEQSAQALFQHDFLALSPAQQDEVLQALAGGRPPGALWQEVDASRFFEELLAELTSTYYAHPLAQQEISYAGFADLPAWTKIGLTEKEDREPESDLVNE